MKLPTARALIRHLEEGLKTLGVDDAPVIFWNREQAETVYSHDVNGKTEEGRKGFFRDEEDTSIHLADYDNSL